MHFGLLAVGEFPPFCLGVGTEAVKGCQASKDIPQAGLLFTKAPALGDWKLGYSRLQGSRLGRGGSGPVQKGLKVFPSLRK